MSQQRKQFKIMIGALAALAVIIAACTPDGAFSPLAPQENALPAFSKKGQGNGDEGNCANAAASDLLLVRKREEAENGVSTALIGPAGGVLTHALHRVIVPAGALRDTVTLTFSMPVSDTLMFELGPDGIQFNLPVTVVLDYDHACRNGIDPETFYASVFNPTTAAWDSVSSAVDVLNDDVIAETPHFSRYALARK